MFKSTIDFSPSARVFLNTGDYTGARKGTFSYKEFWNEEMKRCRDGYTVGTTRITGVHYFYLNYFRIKATAEDRARGFSRKSITFPRFLDMDYYYFIALEKARLAGKGIIVAKARRKGFSYKNAAVILWSYHFERESMNVIGAFLKEFSDTTMYMVIESDNFISAHAGFAKQRQVKNTKDHIRASFIERVNGLQVEGGYKSEVLTLTFKDNPSAAIGKTADLFLFEEAGKWRGLKEAYKLSEPLFKDGDIMTGMPIIFGTGGDMESGTVDFCEMFYSPDTYGLMSYENIWDSDASGTRCGYFVPQFEYHMPFVDADGNSLKELARATCLKERQGFLDKGDKALFEKHLSQHPFTPKEAFLQVTGNIFPTLDLQEQLGFILSNERVKSFGQRGTLRWTGTEAVKWTPSDTVFEAPYPFNEFNTEGCLVIYEHPEENIPWGLYIVGFDPYNQDASANSTSLGASIVYKRFVSPLRTHDIVVAEYIGRPKDGIDSYYDNLHKILIYYNAQVLYESEVRYPFAYFKNKSALHRLKFQPEIIRDIVKDSKVQRTYGMPMNKPIKNTGIQFIHNWLLEKKGVKEDGTQLLNLHTIQSQYLLRELIAYNDEGNFDRVMAFMMVMFFVQDIYKIQVEEHKTTEQGKMFSSLNQRLGFKK